MRRIVVAGALGAAVLTGCGTEVETHLQQPQARVVTPTSVPTVRDVPGEVTNIHRRVTQAPGIPTTTRP